MARNRSTRLATGNSRYNPEQIEQLKRNVSILHACANRGIELKRQGAADYIGRCPFHEDGKPSFVVTPGKNLWHCMGCGKGGSIIDLAMAFDGLDFKQAVDKLLASNGLVRRGVGEAEERLKKEKDESPSVPAEAKPDLSGRNAVNPDLSRHNEVAPDLSRQAALLERTLAVYERNFAEHPEARQYLENRGIADAALFSRFRIGYSTGSLSGMLPGSPPSGNAGPAGGGIREELNAVGILLPSLNGKDVPKRERFAGCVVFPVFDEEGRLTTIYGRKIDPPVLFQPGSFLCEALRRDKKLVRSAPPHFFLPGRPTGLWNAQAVKSHSSVILVESVIDALSVMVAGFPNVAAVQGTNGVKDSDIGLLRRHGVARVTLLLDGDEAGGRASLLLRPRLEAAGLAVAVKALPGRHDPNSWLQEHGAEALGNFLASEAWTPSELPGPDLSRHSEAKPDSSRHSEAKPEPAPPEVPSPACPSNGPDANRRAGADGGQVPGHPSQHPCESVSIRGSDSSLSFTYGLRTYRVLGLDKGSHKLRATVRAEFAGKLHVDTLDFYSARSRRMLAQDLCRIFDETPETVEADIARLLEACEKAAAESKDADADSRPAPVAIASADRAEAEAFGRRPDLIGAILADFETCGLVGEASNKLLAYLAATSRKMDEPLSVLVLSSSGAGKTALQDTALQFVPPEDLVKLTSLSGKALFYKDRLSLKHKVLSLEEGDGAQEATYAIRNLISAHELVIESTIKDLATGRLTTMENRVEGPTSVFVTTTDPETDPETRSRFFVTSIDESPEQTRAILDFQRKRHTLRGLETNRQCDDILRAHRNFQRLLKPVAVVNPFADRLTYADDRLQGRRDQPKYLNLIKAVAFLRQMRKELHSAKRNGQAVPYIEVDLEDVRIANKLAHEILGHSLDELSRPGRALLLLLDEMVERQVERLKKESSTGGPGGNPDHRQNRTSITFSRRDIREFSGWAHTRVHRYLKELIELEYVLADSGRNGTLCRYRLAYEGQGKNGERFMLGLTDPASLES